MKKFFYLISFLGFISTCQADCLPYQSPEEIKDAILVLKQPGKAPPFDNVSTLVLQDISNKEIKLLLTKSQDYLEICRDKDKDLVLFSYSFNLLFRNNSITSKENKIWVNNQPTKVSRDNIITKKDTYKEEKIDFSNMME